MFFPQNMEFAEGRMIATLSGNSMHPLQGSSKMSPSYFLILIVTSRGMAKPGTLVL